MVKMDTDQIKQWSSNFGKEYTERNFLPLEEKERLHRQNLGVTRRELNQEFVGNLDRNIKILEIGSNVGYQLMFLQEMGFTNLYGIELQWYAIEKAQQQTRKLNIIQGTAFDVPYKDNYFDLVFTSGVLIHIHPDDVAKALGEIYRCSKQYIWGYEYFADEYEMVPYRGENLCWRGDFAQMYLDTFSGLVKKMERKMQYLGNDNVDSMFLLEKQ